MKMNDYINDFTNHLTDALLIGESSLQKKTNKSFSNILICGLGGSGIGGTIVKDLISKDAVSYTHLPSPRDNKASRMPSSA